MNENEKLKVMAKVKNTVIDYFQDQLEINTAALKAYDTNTIEDEKRNKEVLQMREIEAIKLRDRIAEISRHIAVIRRMYPDA